MNAINYLICSIPDSVGWCIVGILGLVDLILAVVVAKTFVTMWKERHEDETEEVF